MVDTSAFSHLDAYCERAGDPAFWAEPLNAITNLAFIWFAIQGVKLMHHLRDESFKAVFDLWMLIIFMFSIGIGSGLWHTYAVEWSVIADVVPIYLFINVYIFSLFIRVIGLKVWQAMLVWVAFQSINMGFEMNVPRDTLNGSIMYVPTYMLLITAIIWMYAKKIQSAKALGIITLVFTVSLIFRTIDTEICALVPIGTHFIWHLLNAYVLFHLVNLLWVSVSGRQNKNTSPAQP
ncbi:MAG: ceramidase [Rickettsiales bacterium]|nr:ceramidase [Rickettsiales bacterium]